MAAVAIPATTLLCRGWPRNSTCRPTGSKASCCSASATQTGWLILIQEHKGPDDKVYVLGKSFKPETNIQTGSPSILLKNILTERGIRRHSGDPRVDKGTPQFTKGVYFVGTKHPEFVEFAYPEGSVVLDPWRYIPNRSNVTVLRIGENDTLR